MKLFRFLSIWTIVLAVFSCDRFIPFEQTMISLGYLDADLNGNAWSHLYKNAYQAIRMGISQVPVSPCRPYRNAYLMSVSYNPVGTLQEELYFADIPLTPGKYPLTSVYPDTCIKDSTVFVVLYSGVDEDQPGDNFVLLPSELNYFQVDSFNEHTSEIEGHFEFTLVVEKPKDESRLPDTLRFREGRFHSRPVPQFGK